jgi:hypothetical protein
LQKLTDKQKKKIIADYVDNGSYSETARMNNISDKTVKRLLDKEDKDVVIKVEQKKEENIQSTLEYMQNQHNTKKRILDKLLKAIEEKSTNVDMFTNVRDLATAYGIIIDKELKVLELKNMSKENEGLIKVKELLSKIYSEAQNDTNG